MNRMVINMLVKAIRYLIEFFYGSIYAKLYYNKKYIKGEYFKFGGRGWKWIILDIKARRRLGVNKGVPFPISFNNRINNPQNIVFSPDNLHIFQGSGKYFQGQDAKIFIGDNCYVANNVGIITTNHDLKHPEKHMPGKEVKIGSNCWLGMNSLIMPGVILGNNTVVGAGSVVTKSFSEGNCVIVGNPAKKIKDI